jgi:hypothetical protein
MDNISFDALTRHAAGSISRRFSLRTLSVVGLTALATPLAGAAKKKAGKNKKKKKQNAPPLDVCGPQVEECTKSLNNLFAGNPAGADSIACCSSLATCNFSEFFACLIITGQN